jgi:hypothetical protein
MFPEWKGDLLVGSLKFALLSRLDRDESGNILGEERMLENANSAASATSMSRRTDRSGCSRTNKTELPSSACRAVVGSGLVWRWSCGPFDSPQLLRQATAPGLFVGSWLVWRWSCGPFDSPQLLRQATAPGSGDPRRHQGSLPPLRHRLES